MVLKDTKRPPLECCKWLTVEVIKTVCSTSVPVIDGLGRVNPSRKDGEGVSPWIRICNGGVNRRNYLLWYCARHISDTTG